MDDQGLKTQNQQPLVGTAQKEQGPVAIGNVGEYVTPIPEPSVSEEMERVGVKSIISNPKIDSPDVTYSGAEMPLITEPQGRVELPPLTNEEIEVAEKEKPSSSIKWLATLLRKLFKRHRGE